VKKRFGEIDVNSRIDVSGTAGGRWRQQYRTELDGDK